MMNRVNTYPICDSPLGRSAQRGAARLRYRNRAKITVLMWERMPCPVWSSCQHKSYGMVSTYRRRGVARARLLLETLQVSFVKLRIMFCLFSYIRSASQDVVQPTWWTLTRKFLTLPIILIVIAYNRANLYINCWCWYHHPLMLVWLFNKHEASAISLFDVFAWGLGQSDLWLFHGLVLMLVLISTRFSLVKATTKA